MNEKNGKNIIEVKDLGKRFGEIAAVDGISFQVRSGESFGILGPNGAGKTTTIRMAYGFSPIGFGSLKVFGLDIARDWRAVRARIGVCQQDNNLDPDLTVRENLEIFAGYFDIPRREAKERAWELLRFVSLEHRQDAKVEELSGGMMRRLVIARALINQPELLILDEPTTGLDPQARHQVWQRLEELKSRGLTILITTHYMDEASRLCDRLVIMDHGRILVEGKPMDLIHRYVGKEVVEVAFPSESLKHYVRSQGLEHEDLGNRLIIYSRNGEDIYRLLSREYCDEGCYLRMASLEDVFLKLTGRGLRE
jgi:lipooligosaccharide transport system ATP-binding protein